MPPPARLTGPREAALLALRPLRRPLKRRPDLSVGTPGGMPERVAGRAPRGPSSQDAYRPEGRQGHSTAAGAPPGARPRPPAGRDAEPPHPRGALRPRQGPPRPGPPAAPSSLRRQRPPSQIRTNRAPPREPLRGAAPCPERARGGRRNDELAAGKGGGGDGGMGAGASRRTRPGQGRRARLEGPRPKHPPPQLSPRPRLPASGSSSPDFRPLAPWLELVWGSRPAPRGPAAAGRGAGGRILAASGKEVCVRGCRRCGCAVVYI